MSILDALLVHGRPFVSGVLGGSDPMLALFTILQPLLYRDVSPYFCLSLMNDEEEKGFEH